MTDLETGSAWYRRLLHVEPVLDDWMLLGLHAHGATEHGDRFDETKAGLDHTAFGCADRAEPEAWIKHLDRSGIAHGGVVDAHYGSGVSFRDPDNVNLEFFAPPS